MPTTPACRPPRLCGLSTALAAFAVVAASPPPATACELKAEFRAPAGTSLAGGKPVTWVLRYTNTAPRGDCGQNLVTLLRQPAGGGGSTIGGGVGALPGGGSAGPAQKLPALPPGRSADLTYVEQRPPGSGSHVYSLHYAVPVADADAADHQPTKTVSFSVTLGLGN